MNPIKRTKELVNENEKLKNRISALEDVNLALRYRNMELMRCIKQCIEKREILETLNKYNLEIIGKLYQTSKVTADDTSIDVKNEGVKEVVRKVLNPETLTAVIVEPGKEPYVQKVKNSCDVFDSIVGGDSDAAVDDKLPDTVIICNAEIRMNALRLNRIISQDGKRDYIMGTFIVIGCSDKDFVSLTPEQIETVKTRFALKKGIKKELT